MRSNISGQSTSLIAVAALAASLSFGALAQTSPPATGAGTAIPSKAGTERQPNVNANPNAKDTGANSTMNPSATPSGQSMPPKAGAGTAIPSKAGSERQPTAVDGEAGKPMMKGTNSTDRKAMREERRAERKAKRPTDAGTTNDRKATGTN